MRIVPASNEPHESQPIMAGIVVSQPNPVQPVVPAFEPAAEPGAEPMPPPEEPVDYADLVTRIYTKYQPDKLEDPTQARPASPTCTGNQRPDTKPIKPKPPAGGGHRNMMR